jgi:hypothetical protein
MSHKLDPKRLSVLDVAATTLGTPFVPKACALGAGFDCIMVVRYIGETAGVLKVDEIKARRAGLIPYSTFPRRREIVRALDFFCERVDPDAALPGDLVLFIVARARSGALEPQHLGVFARSPGAIGPAPTLAEARALGTDYLIHASDVARRVVHQQIDGSWRLAGAWRYPDCPASEAGP